MAGDHFASWGLAPLSDVLQTQLDRHGHRNVDATGCADKLSRAIGPATKASLLADLGGFRYLEGDVDGAVASWRQVIVSGHAAPAARALTNLGLLYEEAGEPQKAHELFASSSDWAIAPYSQAADLGQVRCLDALGRVDLAQQQAQALADASIDRDPEQYAAAMFVLAVTQERSRDFRSSETHQRVVELGIEPFAGRSRAFLAVAATPSASVLEPTGAALHQDTAVSAAPVDPLQSADQADDPFVHAAQLIDEHLLDRAIDALEPMLHSPYLAERCRAAYDLAVLYLNNDMVEPATVMLETVRASGEPEWSPRATLVLGDARHAAGDRHAANALWADAADVTDESWLIDQAGSRLSQSRVVVALSLIHI